jgi:hypothetical protein
VHDLGDRANGSLPDLEGDLSGTEDTSDYGHENNVVEEHQLMYGQVTTLTVEVEKHVTFRDYIEGEKPLKRSSDGDVTVHGVSEKKQETLDHNENHELNKHFSSSWSQLGQF